MGVVVQVAVRPRPANLPLVREFRAWGAAAAGNAHVCVRIVDEQESAELNLRYRGRLGAANVLSFPFDAAPAPVARDYLGDVVLAAPLVAREARRRNQPLKDHWAHLFVHGLLHLQGYRHDDDAAATRMEARESDVLWRLGFADPWRDARGAP